MALQHIEDMRKLAEKFNGGAWPEVPCPGCSGGTVSPADENAIVSTETHESISLRDHEAWEPEWIQGYFHGPLRCSRESCKEIVVVAGRYQIDYDDMMTESDYQGPGPKYASYMSVEFFTPPIPLIRASEKLPKSVLELINTASSVLWVDASSAANRVRSAIEELLNLQGVPKTLTDKKGNRRRRTAHQRIELLKARKPKFADAADLLMAVKWIGNDGSHGNELTVSDVLDGVELLNHALELMYDTSPADLKRRAQAINKRKGIPRKRAVAKGSRP